MLTLPELVLFAITTLLLVLTPGPNMIYCVSRALSQGPRAGMVSLAGVLLGFIAHLVAATLGLTAVLTALRSPSTPCASQEPPTCCGSPGTRYVLAGVRRSWPAYCQRTHRGACSRWDW
jgi:hypothetical protein